MKVKNIKVGVRVQAKVNSLGVRIGDVGTVLEDGDSAPYVQWDREDANCTSYCGTPCTALAHFELRKYKEQGMLPGDEEITQAVKEAGRDKPKE